MPYREKTKFKGVYKRSSAKNNHRGKPDICFDITYKYRGRKVWEKIGWSSEGYTAAMASNILGEKLQKMRHGIDPRLRKPLTFDKLAQRYFEWGETAKKTIDADRQMYTKHLKKHLGHLYLDEITFEKLDRIKGQLIKAQYSPATVKHIMIIVRQMFNRGIEWELWTGMNPAKNLKLPIGDNRRTRFLTSDEAIKLLSEVRRRSVQAYEISMLSLQTGMRAGEIFNLKKQDIDFKLKTISIKDPKSGRNRFAFITPDVNEILQNRTASIENDTRVFLSTKNQPISSMSDSFIRAANDIGLNDGIDDRRERVVFHTLRHTFASWLAQNGESLITIAELMGHSDLKMVQRYAHLCPDAKREAALKAAKMLKQKESV